MISSPLLPSCDIPCIDFTRVHCTPAIQTINSFHVICDLWCVCARLTAPTNSGRPTSIKCTTAPYNYIVIHCVVKPTVGFIWTGRTSTVAHITTSASFYPQVSHWTSIPFNRLHASTRQLYMVPDTNNLVPWRQPSSYSEEQLMNPSITSVTQKHQETSP